VVDHVKPPPFATKRHSPASEGYEDEGRRFPSTEMFQIAALNRCTATYWYKIDCPYSVNVLMAGLVRMLAT
jgi:hypothetical protein